MDLRKVGAKVEHQMVAVDTNGRMEKSTRTMVQRSVATTITLTPWPQVQCWRKHVTGNWYAYEQRGIIKGQKWNTTNFHNILTKQWLN